MNEATKKFLEELEQRTDVVGVIMFGSWARGNNRPDSDVDLVVILTEGYRRTVEHRNGQAFEIIYITEKDALAYWESHKDDAAGLWAVAKILFDKDGAIERLKIKTKEVLSIGKKPIDEYLLEQFRFDIEDSLKYVESIFINDPTTANLILTNKISGLTEFFFDIRQIWTPAPKQRLAEIQKINTDFYDLLQQFYQEQKSLSDRLTVARKMVSLVFQR